MLLTHFPKGAQKKTVLGPKYNCIEQKLGIGYVYEPAGASQNGRATLGTTLSTDPMIPLYNLESGPVPLDIFPK